MLKPGPNFRLNKQSKRIAATYVDKNERRAYIRAMVDAQLHSELAPKREPKKPRGNYPDAQTDSSAE